MPVVLGIEFVKGGLVQYYYPPKSQETLHLYDQCVVETDHGLHLAKVIHPAREIKSEHLPEKIRPILRVATRNDLDQFAQNEEKEKEAYKFCHQKATEKKLDMKLVDVSYSLDAKKAVFYFTADNRVDFRELVKDLAHALKLKIEMRQIGVRDEARRLGGVGCCGRSLCCCTFLKDFVSVSIRMAKQQNLSLNPTKVSGLCGRLMCCLSYEYEGKGKQKKDEKSREQITNESWEPEDESGKADGEFMRSECSATCIKQEQAARDEAIKPEIVEGDTNKEPGSNNQTNEKKEAQPVQPANKNKHKKRRPNHRSRRGKGLNKNKPQSAKSSSTGQ